MSESNEVRITFEHVTCTRCGGSGEYSYCEMWGSRCFACHGNKVVLTKRGVAAQALYVSLLSKRAGELVPGDRILTDVWVGQRKWCVVQAVTPDTTLYNGEVRPDSIYISCDNVGICTSKERTFHVAATKEQKLAAYSKALEYQGTLKADGTPYKRPKKAVDTK